MGERVTLGVLCWLAAGWLAAAGHLALAEDDPAGKTLALRHQLEQAIAEEEVLGDSELAAAMHEVEPDALEAYQGQLISHDETLLWEIDPRAFPQALQAAAARAATKTAAQATERWAAEETAGAEEAAERAPRERPDPK